MSGVHKANNWVLKLMPTIKKILIFLLMYLVSWAFSFVVINGDFNFKYMVEYFALAWTFDGLMRPTYTWILSLVIFLPMLGVSLYMTRKRSNSTGRIT